jgi:[ribosomal protein S18]-alanine N-acetyltransferase
MIKACFIIISKCLIMAVSANYFRSAPGVGLCPVILAPAAAVEAPARRVRASQLSVRRITRGTPGGSGLVAAAPRCRRVARALKPRGAFCFSISPGSATLGFMLPSISIRPLRSPDEASRCARLMAGSEPWITLGRGYQESLELLKDPAKQVHVAAAGDAVAGFIVLHLQGPFSGYLQAIAVAPDWRNCGLGGRLIAFAEEQVFRQSPNLFLCVSSFNTAAQRLYLRLGYERIGELKDYLVAGHSEILMRKTIGPQAGFRPPSNGKG